MHVRVTNEESAWLGRVYTKRKSTRYSIWVFSSESPHTMYVPRALPTNGPLIAYAFPDVHFSAVETRFRKSQNFPVSRALSKRVMIFAIECNNKNDIT